MTKDKEFIIRADVDGFERERILSVEGDGIRRAIVNGSPMVSGGQMRVAVALGRSATR
jgi:hypothetical protein